MWVESQHNQLQHIQIAAKWNLDKIAEEFISVIQISNKQKLFGICRLHKHFELKQGEVVASSCVDDALVARVELFTKNMVPWQWQYSTLLKKWVGIEFIDNTSCTEKIPAFPQEVATMFLEYFDTLQSEEIYDQIGLAINISCLFNGKFKQQIGFDLTERTHKQRRIQISKMEASVEGPKLVTRWYPCTLDRCEYCVCENCCPYSEYCCPEYDEEIPGSADTKWWTQSFEAARKDIEKEAAKLLPYLSGEKKYTALLDCSRYFLKYDWSVAKANSKTDEAITIREEAVAFFNALDSKTFSVELADVSDMDCLLRKDDQGRVIQAMVFASMYIASRIVCFLELFGVSKDRQRQNLGRQAVYQLSDFLNSLVGTSIIPELFGIYIITPVSRVVKPHDFYRKLGFGEGTPFGFTCWSRNGADMMHLSVEAAQREEAMIREADLISTKVDKKRDVKASSKKQMRDGNSNVDHLEEEKGDHQGLAANLTNKPAIKGNDSLLKKRKQTEKEQSEDEDTESDASGTQTVFTSKTKAGAINKHCIMGKCTGKRISGNNWARHVGDVHKGSLGNEEGKDFIKCAGIDCNACSQGKYKNTPLLGLLFLVSSFWPLLFGLLFLASSFWPLLFGLFFWSPLFGLLFLASSFWPLLFGLLFFGLLFWLLNSLTGNKGYSGNKKSFICEQCGMTKRYDQYPKDSKEVCKVCLGGGSGSKSHISKIVPKLNKGNLKQLPSSTINERVLGPSDSLSQIGSRRPHSQIDVGDDGVVADSKQPSIIRQQLTNHKEPTLNSYGGNDDMPMEEYQSTQSFQQVQLIAHTDQSVIDQLEALEKSDFHRVVCAQKVQELCTMFTQDLLIKYIAGGNHAKLIDSIITILQRVDQLESNAIVGLAVASMVLGNACWEGTIKMFYQMDNERRERVFTVFKIHLQKHFNDELANWLLNYWRVTEQQHLILLMHQKSSPFAYAAKVLTLSLAVVVQDVQLFLEFSQVFIKTSLSSADMILESIIGKPKQRKITFDQFLELAETIQYKSNAQVIELIKETLAAAHICEWVALINENQASINLLDAATIQSFLDDLINTYGEIKQLEKDLIICDDPMYEMLVQQAENKPNNRQFALAQYCIGKLYTCQRQLWVVPSGQGKSRIAATAAAISLMCEMFSKVHMVFENQHLLQRDKTDFEDYWMVLGYDESRIEYHTKLDFICQQGELVIIDEADCFMFKDPSAFKLFAAEACCLCFTATPDDQEAKGVESRVVTALEFQRFNYSLDVADVGKVSLDVDETIQCESIEKKAQFIKERATQGPVLVYCDTSLTEQLKLAQCDPLTVTEDVDSYVLRQLNQQSNGSFRVVVAQDQFAMRGLDYRSHTTKLSLVIAKSFENKREAIQGFNRVGRFGDTFTRVRFNDNEIIDKKAALAYTAKLFRFFAEMQKSKEHPKLKPVAVKKAKPLTATSTAPPKTIKTNLGQKRFNGLLNSGQTQLQAFIKK